MFLPAFGIHQKLLQQMHETHFGYRAMVASILAIASYLLLFGASYVISGMNPFLGRYLHLLPF